MANKSNVITGLLAVTLGMVTIIWLVPAQTIPAIFASVPSGFYPNFTSGMLVASGAALALSGFFVTAEDDDNSPSATKTIVNVIAALFLLTCAMFAVPYLGFIPAGIGICLVTLLIMRESRKIQLAAISIIVPVLIWLLFELLLGRPLP